MRLHRGALVVWVGLCAAAGVAAWCWWRPLFGFLVYPLGPLMFFWTQAWYEGGSGPDMKDAGRVLDGGPGTPCGCGPRHRITCPYL